MSVFRRHIVSSIFLCLYFLWWMYMLQYIYIPRPDAPVCDFSPVLFLVFTALLGGIYVIAFLIKYIITDKTKKSDYLIFLQMVIWPIVLAALYLWGIS